MTEKVLQKLKITKKDHLKLVLPDEWEKISPNTTKMLVVSMPGRLEAIIKRKKNMLLTFPYFVKVTKFLLLYSQFLRQKICKCLVKMLHPFLFSSDFMYYRCKFIY